MEPGAKFVQPPDHVSLGAEQPVERLRAAFAGAFAAAGRGEPMNLAPLREAVHVYVRAAKTRSEPPERVIIGLKAVTIDARSWFDRTAEQQLLRDAIIGWCLDEYYGPVAETEGGADRVFALRRERGRSD